MRSVKALFLLFVLSYGTQAEGQTVRGIVIEDSTRSPIHGAAVELVAANLTKVGTTITDTAGAFVLRATAPGKYTLQLTHPSYATSGSDTISLAAGEVLMVQLRMGRQAIVLAPVVVTSRGNARLGGFYDRMQRGGFGHYITRADIDKRPGAHRASDLLQGVPGVELIPVRRGRATSGANIISMRGNGRRCPPAIFINGAPLRQIGDSGADDFVTPNSLEAIEVYRSSGGTPAEFQQPGTCGAVVFWTRTGAEEDAEKFNWKRIAVAGGVIAFIVLIVTAVQ
jgi:hypothetical protein